MLILSIGFYKTIDQCVIFTRHTRWPKRLVTSLENERNGGRLKELWHVAVKISDDLGIEPSRKRCVKRQQNSTSPLVSDTKSNYRVACYFAFLDHTLSPQNPIPPELEGALLATASLPGNINSIIKAEIKAKYADHLSYPASFKHEVATWKVHVAEMDHQGADLLSTCNFADNNKLTFTQFCCYCFLSLSDPGHANDHSVCLKTWCRNSMTDERFDQLALGYINHERISPETILQSWDRSRHARCARLFPRIENCDRNLRHVKSRAPYWNLGYASALCKRFHLRYPSVAPLRAQSAHSTHEAFVKIGLPYSSSPKSTAPRVTELQCGFAEDNSPLSCLEWSFLGVLARWEVSYGIQ